MYSTATTPRAAGAKRDWADSITVGPVRLELTAAGPLIGWTLSGPMDRATGAERVELALVFWRRVRLGSGTLWDVYAALFPDRPGGVIGARTGVNYVHRDERRRD